MSPNVSSRLADKKQLFLKFCLPLALLVLLTGFFLLNLQAVNASPEAAVNPGLIPSIQQSQSLTIADRLACQTAVEEVYWQQRIWPDSNPGAKPALNTVISQAGLKAKVDETLAQSLALEQYWGFSITGPMLQAEMERMAANSRQPAVLRSLFAALDNNPTLVAECLARPVLAQRLLQDNFEADERFSGQTFAEWWQEARPDTAVFTAPADDYQLPFVSESFGNDDSWQDTASIPLDDISGDVKGASVWTGTEMIFMGDFQREAFRYNPATDTWQTASTLGGPLGLRDISAVWTGTYVVVSNGCTANNHLCTVSLAGRYDPQADLWEDIPNAPISRTDQSAVWTGTEMIVWGGCTYLNDLCQVYSSTGARYDAASNSWQTMSAVNAPDGRTFPNLVWTGTEMIVWGGHDGNPDAGGRYNPDTDSWTPFSMTNAPVAPHSTTVWTGSEMVAWGGCTGSPNCDTPAGSGAAYDPGTNSWTAVSTTNAPAARYDHEAVWVGDAMIVWGGYNGSTYLNSGSSYDPVADTWTAISSANAPSGRIQHQLLWTDSLVLVWGGIGPADMRTGGRYNPLSDSWTAVSTKDPQSLRTYHSAVWTGAEMLVWGGVGDGTANSGLNTGRRYNPTTDSWSFMSLSGAPLGSWDGSIVWTGTEAIIWGGQSGVQIRDTGGRYNPASNTWTAMSSHEGRTDNAYVWTGTDMLVWGGNTFNNGRSNTGSLYDPATNDWTDITTTGAPSAREVYDSFVWTGDELLVWGGFGNTGDLGTGGRYNPDTDSWQSISNVNAPGPRYGNAAVWSGSEMIIWGGSEYSPDIIQNDGGHYNPDTNSWTTITTTGAPIGAIYPAAVWTGAEMIVWGGICDETSLTCPGSSSFEGGRFNPASGTWTPATLDGVPEARAYHTGVWTGEAMIVYGGIGAWSGYRHTGGLYYASAPANLPPNAADDAYSVGTDEVLVVVAPGVLGNDSDPNGNPLTAVLQSGPSDGIINLNPNGAFTYTPDSGFVGQDAFTYIVSDGQGGTDIGTVTIQVTEAQTIYQLYLPVLFMK